MTDFESNPRTLDKANWMRSVLDAYQAPLVRYATHITGDLDLARDVVQDTFLRLWKQKKDKVEGHLAQWLFTVCRNRALDVLRKEKRMKRMTGTSNREPVSSAPGPAQLLERRETLNRVLRALDSLPPREQEVLRLKFQNGLSYREIAATVGISVSNVGYLIHNGVKKVRAALERNPEPAAATSRTIR